MLGAAPDVPLAALENREFLRRAVRYLAAGRGIGQFVDIGPGLPTQGNVHQLAHRHDPGAKVAYVDNDASVLVHSIADHFRAGPIRGEVAVDEVRDRAGHAVPPPPAPRKSPVTAPAVPKAPRTAVPGARRVQQLMPWPLLAKVAA